MSSQGLRRGWRAGVAAVLVGLFGLVGGAGSGLACAASPQPAAAAGPAVNLLIEVRMVDPAQAEGRGSYTVSTQALAADAPPSLQLQVLNGQAGALQIGRRMPVQWVQAAARGAAGPSGSAAGGEGAVVQAVTWVESGQALWVKPQWPGDDQPVQLVLRWRSVGQGPSPAAANTPLPVQQERQLATRLAVPMGAWTTFAATGTPAAAGAGLTVSTLALSDRGLQWLQVRVSRP